MKPKKSLGQHFLTAPAIAKKIADAVPEHNCGSVVEIGPGRGALSVHLLSNFQNVHLVEIDKDAIAVLTEKLNGGNAYTIHNENALDFDFAKIEPPIHVVGNLPYNIGAHIIKKTLLSAPNVASVTFMVQKEVALRIVAAPHTKDNGFLSIFCNFFGNAKLLFNVPPGSFFPKPAVDSAVFQIVVDNNALKKLDREKWDDFFALVSSGFLMRRKQLAKIMSLTFDKPKDFYESTLKSIGINERSRPEDLDVNMWLELYTKLF